MMTILRSKFEAHLLHIFRHIEQTGEAAIVTGNSLPVLRIESITRKASVDDLFAPYRGKMVIYEELDTPTIIEWIVI